MRALICGDIHGNIVALEKMLQIESNNYDILISHGDIVNYGPWSNECIDQILSLKNAITIMGNHEENYIKGQYDGKNVIAQTFFKVCYPNFDRFKEIVGFLKDYSIGKFLIQHTINNLYIFPDSDIEKIMDKEVTNLIIGHSHHQFEYRSKKGLFLYNTGSVGQNRKYINVINYIIYDIEKNTIEMKRLVYDVSMVINEMKERHYPDICINYYSRKLQIL